MANDQSAPQTSCTISATMPKKVANPSRGHIKLGVGHHLGLDQVIGELARPDEVEDRLEGPHQHLTLDGVVRIAPEQRLHIRLAFKEACIDDWRQAPAPRSGDLKTLFDHLGVGSRAPSVPIGNDHR